MVNNTREPSSIRQQRQQVPSIVEEEGVKRGGDVVSRSGTLFELDILDCPICYHALTVPIFQCDNGHITCSGCCDKLRNKCAICTLPIGKYRSKIMERVVEAVIVTCPNAKHGCTENGANDNRGDVVARSGTLFDLDLLNCPICCNALTKPIFQCDNGHIACSSCCTELRHKCPSCMLPIGIYRSRIMEKVVEAVIVSCPNAKHGCTKKFTYGKELVHEKKCIIPLCYSPAPNCNYTGHYKDLYSHYGANHKDTYKRFRYGYSHSGDLDIKKKISVLKEYFEGPLVVVQCFKEPQGVLVTMNCIAPSAPGVGEFSYDLSYSMKGNSMIYRSSKMNKIQKVSFQTPEKDLMLFHDYLLHPVYLMKCMKICIRQIEKKEEKDDDDDDDDDED